MTLTWRLEEDSSEQDMPAALPSASGTELLAKHGSNGGVVHSTPSKEAGLTEGSQLSARGLPRDAILLEDGLAPEHAAPRGRRQNKAKQIKADQSRSNSISVQTWEDLQIRFRSSRDVKRITRAPGRHRANGLEYRTLVSIEAVSRLALFRGSTFMTPSHHRPLLGSALRLP